MIRTTLLGFVALALSAPLPAQPAPQATTLGRVERQLSAARGRGRVIPGRFIVTLEAKANPREVAASHGVDPQFVYTRVLTGFAGTLSDLARSRLRADNRVVRIEPDVALVATQSTAATWGIDRIDQRILPLDGLYTPTLAGRGVTAYVLDTGIRADHLIFGGRASYGLDVIGDGRNGSDCNGHGTHVAGTIGGGYGYGVAPGAAIVGMRVLDCAGSGATSGIISALDWIAGQGRRPAVVNMSLGGGAVASLDDAVNRLATYGVLTIAAAGNETADACGSSPARVPGAVTVAASDRNDQFASYSNYGACVDLIAPGSEIVSAYYGTVDGLAIYSGTSMATPHVAGEATLLLENNPTMSAAELASAITSSASSGVVAGALSGTVNRLAFVGPVAAPAPVPAPAPAPAPVTEPAPAPAPVANIILRGSLQSSRSKVSAVLSWSGTAAAMVDIFRNGARTATVTNTGNFTQRLPGRGTYRFRVCEANTQTCSNEVSLTY